MEKGSCKITIDTNEEDSLGTLVAIHRSLDIKLYHDMDMGYWI